MIRLPALGATQTVHRAGGPLLLILDRADDAVTPLLSQWTYRGRVEISTGAASAEYTPWRGAASTEYPRGTPRRGAASTEYPRGTPRQGRLHGISAWHPAAGSRPASTE